MPQTPIEIREESRHHHIRYHLAGTGRCTWDIYVGDERVAAGHAIDRRRAEIAARRACQAAGLERSCVHCGTSDGIERYTEPALSNPSSVWMCRRCLLGGIEMQA